MYMCVCMFGRFVVTYLLLDYNSVHVKILAI